MNNDNFMVFVYNAIIALFAFFVAAPMLLNAISLFTVQKRFAKVMVDEGVVKEETVRRLHPKKQVAGVLIIQFNSLTVQRFRNTYKDEMDLNKYNKYVDSHF